MRYVRVPRELPISEIRANEAILSPGRYSEFDPSLAGPSREFVPLEKLLVLRDSRVRVRKDTWYHYAEIGDIDVGTGGITFRKMRGYQVPSKTAAIAKCGDVLISTVRTYRRGIGYVSSEENDLITTSALMNVCDVTDHVPGLTLPYVYSFLRSDFFLEQVWSMLHRGMYPRMDKGALDKVFIPTTADTRTIYYVSALVQVITEKETEIRERHQKILMLIDNELSRNYDGTEFNFTHPSLSEIRAAFRLDTGLYCPGFQAFKHRIDSYIHGSTTLSGLGVKSRRGPNLAETVIGKCLYSAEPKKGWYQLIRPICISDYGVLTTKEYLGSGKSLPLVEQGEIVFGCEATWRSLVLCEAYERCTTNFHGTILYWPGAPIEAVIWLRCILEYFRHHNFLRYIAVGGQGGHLSPDYFDYIPIPKFPEERQVEIAKLYHNAAKSPRDKPMLDTLVDWHRQWNTNLGIWELNREMKALQRTLAEVQEKIIRAETVEVPM